MRTKLHSLIIAAVFTALAPGAQAGNSVGNGIDYLPGDAGIAWFARPDRAIRYCFVKSEDFGVADDLVRIDLETAFGTWANYIRDKRVDPETKRFALDSKLLDQCDGSEDLKFYLGITDERVETAKRLHLAPVSFAWMEGYDIPSRWGRGLVWIGTPGEILQATSQKLAWNFSNNLLGALIHELGHAHGLGHVDGTIMSADLFRFFDIPSESVRQGLAQIDWGCELVFSGNQRAYDSMALQQKDTPDLRAFRTWVGPSPRGLSHSRFIRGALGKHLEFAGTLQVWDDTGRYEFALRSRKLLAQSSQSQNLFKVMEAPGRWSFVTQKMYVYLAELEGRDGKWTPVSITLNACDPMQGAVTISLVDAPEFEDEIFLGTLTK